MTNSHDINDDKKRESQSEKELICTGVYGKVKWFNVKRGYGFVCRNDTQDDVFIHQSAIVKSNPDHPRKSVGEGEEIQFDIVKGAKGNEAANVCGADGNHVKGSEYALRYMRGGRGRGRGGRGRGGRGGMRSRGQSEEYDSHPQEFMRGGGGPPRGGRGFRGGRPYMTQYRKPFPNYDMPPPPMPPPPQYQQPFYYDQYNRYENDYYRGPVRGRGAPFNRGGGRIFRGGPPPQMSRDMPMNYPPYEFEFDRRPRGGRGRSRYRGGRGRIYSNRGRGGSRDNGGPNLKDEGEEPAEEGNGEEHHS